VPVAIVVGAEEHTGNAALCGRSLVVLDRALPGDRRFSALHHGRPQMLDHILVSRRLHGRLAAVEVHNEALGDELVAYARGMHAASSYHAPLVAEFVDAEAAGRFDAFEGGGAARGAPTRGHGKARSRVDARWLGAAVLTPWPLVSEGGRQLKGRWHAAALHPARVRGGAAAPFAAF